MSHSEEKNSDDSAVVLKVERTESFGTEKVHSYKLPLGVRVVNNSKLGQTSSKSNDSLDSGVSLRPKSTDSMDSFESSESGYNGGGTMYPGLSPSDEALPPLPTHQYEDYMREVQDIRQSIIVKSGDDEKLPVSRSDSLEEPDEDAEAEWFEMAGLADLVMSSSNTMLVSEAAATQGSSSNVSSHTVLSTLTRPQREAVLRRISSFNRTKTKRRSKPSLASVFPSVNLASNSPTDVDGNKNKRESEAKLEKPSDEGKTSLSLPQAEENNMKTNIPRRYSELGRMRTTTLPVSTRDFDETDSSLFRMDYKHKKNVNSIVASDISGGIETISISKGSFSDGSSWKGSGSLSLGDSAGKVPKSMSYTEAAKQESLPNYSLVRDRLGITKISDLHAEDLRKVQSLALIELTALFDLRNIDFKRRKLGKNKLKESGVFGIPLSMLVECDKKRTNNPDLRVPVVLSEIISFLENNALKDEGILRKSGSAARIKMLKQDIEARFSISSPVVSPLSESQAWKEAHPNDVAALLKQFLRELPDPLLTTKFIEAFQSCGLVTDQREHIQALNLLVILLSDVHRDSLKLLLKFLAQVVVNEADNKMSLNNVAMITAPNLFISGRKSKKENAAGQDLKHAAGTSNIVRMLIKYHKLLWTIPAFMVAQVRLMNGAQISSKKHHSTSKEKYKKFFQGSKKDPSKKSQQTHQQPFDYDTPKNVIRVQAPNMKLTSIAVQLDEKLTAGDVIVKYQRQCERMRNSTSDAEIEVNNTNYALHEVGGNIKERRLDPDSNMTALLKTNPEVTWFIRARKDI